MKANPKDIRPRETPLDVQPGDSARCGSMLQGEVVKVNNSDMWIDYGGSVKQYPRTSSFWRLG